MLEFSNEKAYGQLKARFLKIFRNKSLTDMAFATEAGDLSMICETDKKSF